MAIGGVVINFALNTRDAVRDLTKFTRETAKADDNLADLDRALDRGERGFDSFGDEVDDTLRRFKQDMTQMGAAVDGAADDVNRHTDRMRQDMSDAGRESGAEFISNVAEGIGSGEGNLQDVVSGTLGGLTNLAGTLAGPVGLAAGAAAAGIGLVFSKMRAEAEDAKARLDSMRGALEDLGDTGSDIAEKAIFEQWIADAQETTGKIEKVRDTLGLAGVTAAEFQGALAGNTDDLETVRSKVGEIEAAIYRAYLKQGYLTDEQLATRDAARLTLGEVNKTDAAVGGVRREQSAVNDLTSGAIGTTKRWESAVANVAGETENVKDDLNSIDGRTVNVNVKWKESTRPGGLPGGKSVPVPPDGATVTGMAAPQQVTMNVWAAGALPTTPRELVALLESHAVRMGRRRGQPRAVAW